MAGPSHSESLVIVLDADFVRIASLPSERDPKLVIDPYALPARLIAPQLLQSVAGRDCWVVQAQRDVDRLQLPLVE
jgi:hypothetical protein